MARERAEILGALESLAESLPPGGDLDGERLRERLVVPEGHPLSRSLFLQVMDEGGAVRAQVGTVPEQPVRVAGPESSALVLLSSAVGGGGGGGARLRAGFWASDLLSGLGRGPAFSLLVLEARGGKVLLADRALPVRAGDLVAEVPGLAGLAASRRRKK